MTSHYLQDAKHATRYDSTQVLTKRNQKINNTTKNF